MHGRRALPNRWAPRRWAHMLAPGLAVASVGLVWAACAALGSGEGDAPNPFLNATGTVAYVGDAACADCHADLHASYQSHGMANAFYRLTPENAVEDFSGVVVAHEATGFYYVAQREGERFVQEEYRLGPDGRKTHRLVRAMDYVVGSGSAARTYLTDIGGRLHELPLTWYTQADSGRGRWDFSPGYREHNQRFGRTIPDRCMACHNGISEPVPFVEGAFRTLSEGIGCERCHGPGALHVQARQESEEAPDSVDYTIVNPSHLTLERRLDVCQQCHLIGSVSLLREGEAAFGFLPSQSLAEHQAVFALAGGDAQHVPVISHADRMRQSPCFIESGTMTCTTCHNPHEGFREAGPAYFNRTCQGCHAPARLQAEMPTPALRQQHAGAANCVSCHMPKVEAADAPHASFTDHFIRVVRDGERLVGTAQERADATLAPYFEGDEEREAAAAYEGMAYIVYGRQNGSRQALERGVGLLADALAERPAQGEAQFLLGFARVQLGRVAEAIPALEEAARLGPGIPERLNALAQAYEAQRRNPQAIETLYRRALDAQPAAAEIRVNYGRFLEAQGQNERALAEYDLAARHAPALAAAHYNMGTLLARVGQGPAAVASLREAVRLEPLDTEALANLGVLLAQQGATDEATGFFRRAVEAAPRNADAHANLSLALAQQGALAEARRHAETALSLNPQQQTARQVLGALQNAGP